MRRVSSWLVAAAVIAVLAPGCGKEDQMEFLDCAAVGTKGFCDGSVLYWCEGEQALKQNCGNEGKSCSLVSAEVGFGCLAEASACGKVTAKGTCLVGTETLVRCEEGELESTNCATEGKECGKLEGGEGYGCVDAGEPRQEDIDIFCGKFPAAVCGVYLRCPTDPLLKALDELYCQATETAACLGRIRPAVKAGRIAFDAAAGDQWLEFLAAVDCKSLYKETKTEEWEELGEAALKGMVPEGGECYSLRECADKESRCTAGGYECPGICEALAGAGASCEMDEDCRSDLYCDWDNDLCVKRKGAGAECLWSSECGPGLRCPGDACIPTVVEGEACDEEEDACVYAQCKGGKCVPLPGLGDDCEWLGKGCGAGYCGEADVCEPGNQEGGNCLFYDECAAGLACAGDVCLPLRTAGEPCSDDWECDTIFCDGGTCSAMLDPENSCLAGCIAGTRKCEGTTVMECADDGSAFAEVEECGEGMGCTAGQCVACESHAYTGCHDGNAWWFNGCDNPEELAEECSYDEVCEYGECTEPEPSCELYDCDSEGFGYTCGSGSYQINYSYCSNGNVSGVSVDYGNGHTVWCTFDCSGWGGSCNDDTGASCYF